MVFSSLVFLFRFMPVFFLIYYLVPGRFRNPVLFIGSIIFYAWGEPRYTILILCSVMVNHSLAVFISRFDLRFRKVERRVIFILALFYNIGMLFVFKYTGFLISTINTLFRKDIPVPVIALPLGISFYTFQIMSYVIDVYLGKTEAEKNLLNLGTYLVMFPQLIAGPIVTYSRVKNGLKRRKLNYAVIDNGAKLFVMGLGEKVIFANSLGNIWTACKEAGFENISTLFAWMGISAYTLQLYFDFAGYSLMAIGLGQMLGFRFPKNFNHPYASRSVTEFWKRWHITLTSWFREYLYIPLGGNRKGPARTILNMLIVWLITGLWHGAAWNFVLWGLYYFLILLVERLFLKRLLDRYTFFSWLYTMLIVMIGWVFFASPTLVEAFTYLGRMFTINPGTDFIEFFYSYWYIFALAVLFASPVPARWYRKHRNSALTYIFLVAVFLISTGLLVDSVYNPFLYFRF
ncbi:MAG: MBOAT family protein [Lachnospiraceae bacterium]|nr:MBOAT family protein [Lachnospiraceae bacterium]